MRLPSLRRKEEDIASLAARATRVGSAELAWPRLRTTATHEETREAAERMRRRRAKFAQPS